LESERARATARNPGPLPFSSFPEKVLGWIWMCVQFVCLPCVQDRCRSFTIRDTRRPVLYEARMRRAYGSEERRDGPLGAGEEECFCFSGVHFVWLCFRVDPSACMVVMDVVSFQRKMHARTYRPAWSLTRSTYSGLPGKMPGYGVEKEGPGKGRRTNNGRMGETSDVCVGSRVCVQFARLFQISAPATQPFAFTLPPSALRCSERPPSSSCPTASGAAPVLRVITVMLGVRRAGNRIAWSWWVVDLRGLPTCPELARPGLGRFS